MDTFEKNDITPEEPIAPEAVEEPAAVAEEAAEEAEEAVEEAEEATEEAEEATEEAEEAAEEAEEATEEAEEAAEEAEEAAEEAEEAVEEAEEAAEEAEEAAEEEAEEAADETDAPAAPQTPEDALVLELEGIRDLLQQALDNPDEAPEGEAGDGEEAGEEAPEDIPEEERCRCCGEKRRDQSFGKDYPYCADCRNVMKHTPLRIPAVLMTLFAFALAFAALYFCGISLADYDMLMEAEQHYAQDELTDAVSQYATYFSQKDGAQFAGPTDFADSYSVSAVKHAADTFMRLGYFGNANDILTKFLGEKQLNKRANKKYLAITQEYVALADTSEAIYQILGDVLDYGITEGVDLEARDAMLQKLLTTPPEEGKAPYNAAFVEFYRYVVMRYQDKPVAEQLKQLEMVRKLDADAHPWMYIRTMALLATEMGDEALTEQYANEALKINAQDAGLYAAWANVYRFKETPDTQHMLDIAAIAQPHASAQEPPVHFEIMAVAYLLQGKEQEAMQAMEDYMNFKTSNGYPPYTISSCNLYALCSLVVGSEEGYDEMDELLMSYGYALSDQIEKYKSGSLTLEQVLLDEGGAF